MLIKSNPDTESISHMPNFKFLKSRISQIPDFTLLECLVSRLEIFQKFLSLGSLLFSSILKLILSIFQVKWQNQGTFHHLWSTPTSCVYRATSSWRTKRTTTSWILIRCRANTRSSWRSWGTTHFISLWARRLLYRSSTCTSFGTQYSTSGWIDLEHHTS